MTLVIIGANIRSSKQFYIHHSFVSRAFTNSNFNIFVPRVKMSVVEIYLFVLDKCNFFK